MNFTLFKLQFKVHLEKSHGIQEKMLKRNWVPDVTSTVINKNAKKAAYNGYAESLEQNANVQKE